ncbi:hypothetical protein DPMN_189700 [Dreissena polymorpha]|uniref:Uncharacterized protein n=1 Tax=Dreissena polymorpha TaxID=45954 RepID=A0A9D4IB98_DREPO|nr:hypothetical protein DPMN_189700 [Dreissena polymorpha]
MMMDSTSPGHPVLHKTQRARVTPSFARLDEPRSPRPSQDSTSSGHTVLRKTRRAQVTPVLRKTQRAQVNPSFTRRGARNIYAIQHRLMRTKDYFQNAYNLIQYNHVE